MSRGGAPRLIRSSKQIPLFWQFSLRREFVDDIRQEARELREQIIARHAGLAFQTSDGVGPERLVQLIGRDGLVGASSDPGLDDLLQPAPAEPLNQTTQTFATWDRPRLRFAAGLPVGPLAQRLRNEKHHERRDDPERPFAIFAPSADMTAVRMTLLNSPMIFRLRCAT